MPQAVFDIRGKQHTWGITCSMSHEQIKAMNEDGIDVGTLENVIPAWVVEAGYGPARVWCFFQDIWNFKNPWR